MNKILLSSILVALLIVGAVAYYYTTPGKYDEFAKCLSEKQVVMYGAFWCPHCKEQKAEFGKSFEYVPYVECAAPDNPNAQVAACRDAGVNSYPTWQFSDGTQQSGKLALEHLAQKTGCVLPGAA